MADDGESSSTKGELGVEALQELTNAFDLSPEQQDTASLLRRLLGKAVAYRYIDFCRLAAGAFALNVSRPMAAHALRELDSTLRHALAVPMDAKVPDQPENAEKIVEARKLLKALGCFDDGAIQRATDGLKPRLNHRAQIRKIVARLGLDPEGDIADRWTSLCDSFGKAHQRSFHRSLEVDDEFRSQYQRPFDTVVRAVAAALEGRYTAFMRRVEEIAAMPNRAEAVAAFAGGISRRLTVAMAFLQRPHHRRLAAAFGEGMLARRAVGRAGRRAQRRIPLPAMARRKLPAADGREPRPGNARARRPSVARRGRFQTPRHPPRRNRDPRGTSP